MVYAPPNATVEYHGELINYLQSLPNQVLLLGDSDINWSTFTGSSNISVYLPVYSRITCELIIQLTNMVLNVLDLLLIDCIY